MRYIAGNKFINAFNLSKKILSKNRIPVINYAVEDKSNSDVFHEYEYINKHLDDKFKIAIKLSSLNYDKKFINELIDMYKDKNIKVLVDAESDNDYKKYRLIMDDLLSEHNKDKCNILKTYQMYRKDSMAELRDDLKNHNNLGCKLVRGAYWNSDNKSGNLFINKIETDSNYNTGIKLLARNKSGCNVIATHNNYSIDLVKYLNDRNLEYGKLLNFNNKKYENVVNNKINVYIPYGPYFDMIPYLYRRLYENLDSIKYMS
jgi:hypothetical protein